MKRTIRPHLLIGLCLGLYACGAVLPAYALIPPEGVTVAGAGAASIGPTPAGVIASEMSLQAVSNQITLLSSDLAMQLKALGSSITSQVDALQATIEAEFSNQNAALTANTNSAMVAKARARAMTDMGPLQQPQNMCDAPALGAGIQVGSQTNRALMSDMVTSAVAHNTTTYTRPIDAVTAITSAPAAVFESAPLFPSSGSVSSQNLGLVTQWANVTTSPHPLPPIQNNSANNVSALRYSAAVRVDSARLAVPQNTMAMISSLHIASINVGTWSTDTWDAITGQNGSSSSSSTSGSGSTQTPPGVINGKISDNALTRLQVMARYANPSWYIALATKNTNGVLRDIAIMDSVRMHMEYVRLRLTERMAAMLAQITSQAANREERRTAGAPVTGYTPTSASGSAP